MQKTLRPGNRGDEVKQLQALLNAKLILTPKISEDGIFGPNTEILIKKFQAISNLGIDGVVGPATWAALTGKSKPNENPAVIAPVTSSTPWMTYARNEIKQKEIKDAEHNPRIIAYHATTTLNADKDETAWCSSFVNWCLKQAGIKGTDSAAAISWLKWGKNINDQAGAITVIYNSKKANSSLTTSGNHVGFLVQETATHFAILGGNQSDQVKISSYPKSAWNLKGYRWPNL